MFTGYFIFIRKMVPVMEPIRSLMVDMWEYPMFF